MKLIIPSKKYIADYSLINGEFRLIFSKKRPDSKEITILNILEYGFSADNNIYVKIQI